MNYCGLVDQGYWLVAIYLPNKELPEERTVVGTRQDAQIAARSIIDAWLKKTIPRVAKVEQPHDNPVQKTNLASA